MSGITTGVGIFSGIDTNSLITQILQAESRPRLLAQQRLVQLQAQQAAILDINSRLGSLGTAAAAFRTQETFQAKSATSTNKNVLTATAGASAQSGNYTFVVDRLVSTQAVLSRGFSDRDESSLGLDEISFENALGRLDRETALSQLNDGSGIQRGKISVSDGTNSAEIDLSKAGTVTDVINAINSSSEINVTARADGNKLVIEGATAVTNVGGGTTADSLGLSADAGATVVDGVLTGATIYRVSDTQSLNTLNDGGGGVGIAPTSGTERFDFTIKLGEDDSAVSVNVNIGEIRDATSGDNFFQLLEGPVSTLGGVVERINAALEAKGETDVVASINDATGGITITDAAGREITVSENNQSGANENFFTARDLGLAGVTSAGGVLNGQALVAGLNTTLARNLNGGNGIEGDGILNVTLRNGDTLTIDVSAASTVQEVLDTINSASSELIAAGGGGLIATLNKSGNGIALEDTTGGSGNLIVTGTDGDDTAASLGISTGATGVTRSTINGSSLELRYVREATLLSEFAGGSELGAGSFRITDSNGGTAVISLTAGDKTVGQLIRQINNAGLDIKARVNDNGDGIVIEEDTSESGAAGSVKIKIEDVSGGIAGSLGLTGEAEGTGAKNTLGISLERTVDLDPADTLDDVIEKINDAGPGVSATLLNDGSPGTPYRLSIASDRSGAAGRFVLDSGDVDLGLTTLSKGQDARVFFGSDDPADGVLLTSSDNTLDGVLEGVSITLAATNEDPVQLTVAVNQAQIETAIDTFVSAFNDVLGRIDNYTRYVPETEERGTLLGDGSVLALRSALVNEIFGNNRGFTTGVDNLTQVGLTIGEGGKLTFDKDRFREAFENNPEAVEDLFSRRTEDENSGTTTVSDGITARDPLAEQEYSELGVIQRIDQFVQDYVNSIDGVLTNRDESIRTQISLQEDRITAFTARLENRRDVLTRQFTAMEEAIAGFQTQSQALASLG